MDEEEKLCDELVTASEFTCLGSMMSAGGGCCVSQNKMLVG